MCLEESRGCRGRGDTALDVGLEHQVRDLGNILLFCDGGQKGGPGGGSRSSWAMS